LAGQESGAYFLNGVESGLVRRRADDAGIEVEYEGRMDGVGVARTKPESEVAEK
jgi:hypothetical protein